MTQTPSEIRNSLQKPKDREKLVKAMKGETEDTLQGLCEGYLTVLGIWYLRIPSEVYALCDRYSTVDVKVKRAISENLAGVPDLLIFKREFVGPPDLVCQDNSCLLVELKTKKGTLSPRQKKWRKETIVHVPRNFEHFKELIDRWK